MNLYGLTDEQIDWYKKFGTAEARAEISAWETQKAQRAKNPLGFSDIELRFRRGYGTPEEREAIAAWEREESEKLIRRWGTLTCVGIFVAPILIGLAIRSAGLSVPFTILVIVYLLRGTRR